MPVIKLQPKPVGSLSNLQIWATTKAQAAGTCRWAPRWWVFPETVHKAQHMNQGGGGRRHHCTHGLPFSFPQA